VQQQHMRELNASQTPTAKCPQCGTRNELRTRSRPVKTVDGQTDLQELVGDCPRCRRAFFPDARNVGP
jgi:DNA-directed RNA polymerase subunit RPC12/RpoP